MAIGSFEFFSDCLRRNVSFRIVLPNEGDVCGEAAPMKLLVLLHGYCGCSGDCGTASRRSWPRDIIYALCCRQARTASIWTGRLRAESMGLM